MNAADYAETFAIDLHTHDLTSPRSLQADEGQIGASSFGCREEMRRVITRSEKTDSPNKMAALIGGYCDDGFKRARAAADPTLILNAEYEVTLPNGYSFPVHPDEVDPANAEVTDFKTTDKIKAVRRGHVDDSYRFQRHLQYLAAHQAGVVPAEGITRNVFVDRTGRDPRPHVEQEPFSMDVIYAATEWLNDVLYAAAHDEEAYKDRPRQFCKDFCAFYSACRGPEIIPERITDPKIIAMIADYDQAYTAAKANEALRQDLREILAGTSGKTPTHLISSTWVNAQPTGYWKVQTEVRP